MKTFMKLGLACMAMLVLCGCPGSAPDHIPGKHHHLYLDFTVDIQHVVTTVDTDDDGIDDTAKIVFAISSAADEVIFYWDEVEAMRTETNPATYETSLPLNVDSKYICDIERIYNAEDGCVSDYHLYYEVEVVDGTVNVNKVEVE